MNKLKPKPAIITRIEYQSPKTKLFTIKLINSSDRSKFNFASGQFVQVSIPGFGEAPFSICSNPKQKERFQILAQNVGSLTSKLFRLTRGDEIGIRGPLGNGFPIDKFKGKNISLISGGCGLAPIRSLILEISNNQDNFNQVDIFYGSKNYQSLYFKDEFTAWKKFTNLNIIVEEKNKNWSQPTGYVSQLIEKKEFSYGEVVVICGPQPMLWPIIEILKNNRVKNENIYLSLERNMSCGVGTCQHCNFGSKYVCKDGPVFNLNQILIEEPNFFS